MNLAKRTGLVAATALTLVSLTLPMTDSLSSYSVIRLRQPVTIDGNWDKPAWQAVPPLRITHYMGDKPNFEPVVTAKMQYDTAHLYVIFRVQDRFVRVLTQDINGPVWEDACVEFFFAPNTAQPTHYFNLETNAGGTPLMQYSTVARQEVTPLPTKSIQAIEIAHSLPQRIDPEIKDSVTWTLEYRIPLEMLQQHAVVTTPEPGVVWHANFYKIAENNTNPHYMTWAPIDLPAPNFHAPQFFGELKFQ